MLAVGQALHQASMLSPCLWSFQGPNPALTENLATEATSVPLFEPKIFCQGWVWSLETQAGTCAQTDTPSAQPFCMPGNTSPRPEFFGEVPQLSLADLIK